MNRFFSVRRSRAAVFCAIAALALAVAPGRGEELANLLALGEGALVAVEPESYGGWGPVNLLDEAASSGWAGATGVTGGQVLVFELAETAILERFEFDQTCLDGDGRGAKHVRVAVSKASKEAGFTTVVEAALAERADGQSFVATKKVPARFVRLEVVDNHGDPEWVELCALRGYGARPAATALGDVSGTYESSYASFHVRQQGGALRGCYEYNEGLLSGSVSGRVMKLTWTENAGNSVGPAVMVFSPDGKSFRGHWWSGTDRDQEPSGEWNGTRLTDAVGGCPHWSGSVGGEVERALADGGRARLYGIEFDLDSATLRAESKPALDDVAKTLVAHPDWKVAIEGHTDATGAAAHNQQLSEARAASVRDYLAGHGVAAERLASAGFGATKPVADNATELGRARNRRVEIARR